MNNQVKGAHHLWQTTSRRSHLRIIFHTRNCLRFTFITKFKVRTQIRCNKGNIELPSKLTTYKKPFTSIYLFNCIAYVYQPFCQVPIKLNSETLMFILQAVVQWPRWSWMKVKRRSNNYMYLCLQSKFWD